MGGYLFLSRERVDNTQGTSSETHYKYSKRVENLGGKIPEKRGGLDLETRLRRGDWISSKLVVTVSWLGKEHQWKL